VGVVRDRLKGVVVMKKTIIGAMKMEGGGGGVVGIFPGSSAGDTGELTFNFRDSPHLPQNFFPPGISFPHDPQNGISAVMLCNLINFFNCTKRFFSGDRSYHFELKGNLIAPRIRLPVKK
jgi:hypothetical protein